MPAPVAGIHVFHRNRKQVVDSRNKPGQERETSTRPRPPTARFHLGTRLRENALRRELFRAPIVTSFRTRRFEGVSFHSTPINSLQSEESALCSSLSVLRWSLRSFRFRRCRRPRSPHHRWIWPRRRRRPISFRRSIATVIPTATTVTTVTAVVGTRRAAGAVSIIVRTIGACAAASLSVRRGSARNPAR